jgi:protein-S-isoprenylcysteine O-methyltransferase Ste14
MKHKYFIDSNKAATALVVLAMIFHYRAFDVTAAWIYLALHGTYGFLWITKSRFFGDKQWERPVSLGYGLVTWAGLSLYWVTPWLITSGRAPVPPGWYLCLSITIYTVGIFLHFVSDMQKHMSLSYRRGVLITDGLWGRVRNPNYLGELLVYGGFGMLAMHWAPFVVLAVFIAAIWVPNMLRKDKSLSRYSEFAEYKARSRLILPFLV